MNSFFKISAIFSVSALSLSGCMLGDMHDSTLEMNAKMSETNAGVTATNTAVTATYLDLRKKDTASERNESIEMMEKAEEMAPKLAYASAYLASMEFQVFEPKIEDGAAREILLNEGVRQYFLVMKGFISNRDNVSAKSTNGKMKNLYAMAAGLHYVNSRQELALKGTNYPVMSMLDVITRSLEIGHAIKLGQMSSVGLPAYVAEVLHNEQDAVYILQIRQNFLTAFGFAMSASPVNGDDLNLFQKGWFLIGHGKLGLDWSPVLNDRNTSQIQYLNLVLQYALMTRQSLAVNGYDPKSDESILKIFRNIDWSKLETPRVENEGINQRERQQAIEELKATVAKIVG